MTDPISVAKLLEAAAEKMWLAFERLAQVSHPAEKGRGREDAVHAGLTEPFDLEIGGRVSPIVCAASFGGMAAA